MKASNSGDKYGSDPIPFDGETAEIETIEQQVQRIKDAFVPVAQCFLDVWAPVAQSIMDALAPIIDDISRLWDDVLKSYPDKRVVWLAFYHKKEKVRKKNRARIAKYLAKGVSDNGTKETG